MIWVGTTQCGASLRSSMHQRLSGAWARASVQVESFGGESWHVHVSQRTMLAIGWSLMARIQVLMILTRRHDGSRKSSSRHHEHAQLYVRVIQRRCSLPCASAIYPIESWLRVFNPANSQGFPDGPVGRGSGLNNANARSLQNEHGDTWCAM